MVPTQVSSVASPKTSFAFDDHGTAVMLCTETGAASAAALVTHET